MEIILELKRRALQAAGKPPNKWNPGWRKLTDQALETAYERQVRELGAPLDS